MATETSADQLWAGIGKFLSAILSMILIPIIGGFIIQILWAWFITVIFHVQPLTLPEAIGLSIFVRYLTYNYAPTPTNTKTNWLVYTGAVIGLWLIVLVEGWIVHLFI